MQFVILLCKVIKLSKWHFVYPELFAYRYKVSNTGKVIRINYTAYSKKTGKPYNIAYRKLTQYTYSNGYPCVILTDKDGKLHKYLVHRLVAYYFVANPDNLPLVNHKDENKANCKYTNLEWCTYEYNNTYNDIHIQRAIKLKGRRAHNAQKVLYVNDNIVFNSKQECANALHIRWNVMDDILNGNIDSYNGIRLSYM